MRILFRVDFKLITLQRSPAYQYSRIVCSERFYYCFLSIKFSFFSMNKFNHQAATLIGAQGFFDRSISKTKLRVSRHINNMNIWISFQHRSSTQLSYCSFLRHSQNGWNVENESEPSSNATQKFYDLRTKKKWKQERQRTREGFYVCLVILWHSHCCFFSVLYFYIFFFCKNQDTFVLYKNRFQHQQQQRVT